MDKPTITFQESGILKILVVVCFVLLLISGTLAVFLQRVNEGVEELSIAVSDVDRSTHEIDTSVDELVEFTREIREPTPEEQSRSQATVHAVELVPLILQLLCRQYPGDPVCQGG